MNVHSGVDGTYRFKDLSHRIIWPLIILGSKARWPAGAATSLPARRGETAVDNSHGRFVWYELITTDLAAARAFYAAVLGWGAHDAGGGYTLFTAGGTTVCGLMPLSDEASRMGLRPSWLGYVGVDDVDVAAERIRELGGTVHVPPMEIPKVSRLSVA